MYEFDFYIHFQTLVNMYRCTEMVYIKYLNIICCMLYYNYVPHQKSLTCIFSIDLLKEKDWKQY